MQDLVGNASKMKAWGVFILMLLCSLPRASNGQTKGDKIRSDMLTFNPAKLVYNENVGQLSVSILCKQPEGRPFNSYTLMLEWRYHNLSQIDTEVVKLVAEYNNKGEIKVGPDFQARMASDPMISVDLIDVTLNVDCHDSKQAGVRFRCRAVRKQGNSFDNYHQLSTLDVTLEKSATNLTSNIGKKTVKVGEILALACSAVLRVETDSDRISWMWQYRVKGRDWSNYYSNTTESVNKCLVTYRSNFEYNVTAATACTMAIRCYAVTLSDNLQIGNTAKTTTVNVEGCVEPENETNIPLEPAAIALASVGSFLLLLGIISLSAMVVLSKRRKELRYQRQLDNMDRQIASKAQRYSLSSSPIDQRRQFTGGRAAQADYQRPSFSATVTERRASSPDFDRRKSMPVDYSAAQNPTWPYQQQQQEMPGSYNYGARRQSTSSRQQQEMPASYGAHRQSTFMH